MHVYVHLWLPNDGDKNQQKTSFLACSHCNMFVYWLAIPFIDVMFFY